MSFCRAAPSETSWLVFDAEAVTHVDSSGIEMLSGLQREFEGEQITLVVARLLQRMLPDLEAADLVEQIGRERFYPSVNRDARRLQGRTELRADASPCVCERSWV